MTAKDPFIRKSLLCCLLLLFTAKVYTQSFDTVSAVITYEQYHVRDTANRNNVSKDIMFLYISNSSSLFTGYDMFDDGSVNPILAGKLQMEKRNTANNELLKNFSTKKLIEKQYLLSNNYLIDDTLPLINWSILPDIKNINGLNCQRAMGRQGGRMYEAWFCADLPYADGPWKLTGLPGLILEAADTKHEVVFKLLSINLSPQKRPISFSFRDAIRTTRKELALFMKRAETDPASLTEGKIKADAGGKYQPLSRINNPIDLDRP